MSEDADVPGAERRVDSNVKRPTITFVNIRFGTLRGPGVPLRGHGVVLTYLGLCCRRRRIIVCDSEPRCSVQHVSLARHLPSFFRLGITTASGLLWLSEIIEEYSRTSKTVGIRATYVCKTRLNHVEHPADTCSFHLRR